MTGICTVPNYELKELNNLFIELTAKNCNQRCKCCYIKFPLSKSIKDFISIDKIKEAIEDTKSDNPLERLAQKDVKNELQQALQQLPERERMVMVLYYHENMTLKEIGASIDVSESRVCQIHAQAIMKLRNILNKNSAALITNA